MSAAFRCDQCGKFFEGRPIREISTQWVFPRIGTLPRAVLIRFIAESTPDLCANCFKMVCVDAVDITEKNT